MPHLQRPTTLLLALLVAVGQLAGVVGFYWYQMAGISSGSFIEPGTLTPEPASVSYSLTWGRVYLGSVVAGGLVSLFAAKGTKLWCALLLIVLLPLAPWALLLLVSPQVGA